MRHEALTPGKMRPVRPSPPLPFPADRLRAVLAPLERASPLPPAAHLDEAVLAVDLAHVFGERAWLCAGREDEIAEPGAWLLAPITREGILVVRGEDGAARAFYNVCPHRGATLVEAAAGCASRLVCPYHGFTFGLDGGLVSGRVAGERAMPGLTAVRAAALHGFLFVCLDPEAP